MEIRISSKEAALRVLGSVPEDKVFWVSDGSVIRSLEDLAKSLEKMSNETFKQHCNKEKNDFSNWIKDVIGDVRLANELKKNKTKTHAIHKIKRRIEWLKKI